MKKFFTLVAIAALAAGCSDADVASSNLSKAADNFEVTRHTKQLDGVLARDVGVVFFYSHTDEHGLPHYRLRAA